MPDAKRLKRLHRVRTLQLGLARAEESRTQAQLTSETQLAQRIAQLASAVAPAPRSTAGAVNLAAAAHFRDRLHRSAEAAMNRVRMAEQQVERSAEATRGARRDQSAVEKLLERQHAADLRAEMKALEDVPARPKR
jgi:flagellar biosynthesis chaperone FliJ